MFLSQQIFPVLSARVTCKHPVLWQLYTQHSPQSCCHPVFFLCASWTGNSFFNVLGEGSTLMIFDYHFQTITIGVPAYVTIQQMNSSVCLLAATNFPCFDIKANTLAFNHHQLLYQCNSCTHCCSSSLEKHFELHQYQLAFSASRMSNSLSNNLFFGARDISIIMYNNYSLNN